MEFEGVRRVKNAERTRTPVFYLNGPEVRRWVKKDVTELTRRTRKRKTRSPQTNRGAAEGRAKKEAGRKSAKKGREDKEEPG